MNIDHKKLIEKVNTRIEEMKLGSRPPELYEPISYIMSLGGKRMRPLLVLFGYLMYGDEADEVLDVAVAVEAFHNFTLMHDDIMDNAPLRRGKPTVHEKWNTSTAILSGDVMLVKVYEQLMQVIADNTKLRHVLKTFNQAAAEVCEGQEIDMLFENRSKVSHEEYIEMIRLKTAVLLAASLKIGGIMAGASSENLDALYDFGVYMGIGFQLMDDYLDVYGDMAKFGKQVGGDIISNKKTYLLIRAMEKADKDLLNELNNWISSTKFIPEVKVLAVTDIYNRLDIKTETRDLIRHYFDKAYQQLDRLDAPAERKSALKHYADALIKRDH